MPMHPSDVLFRGETAFPVLPAVVHYAGTEKLMKKALALQGERGPIFDITFDCEDGAPAGHEMEHAEMCAALAGGIDNRYNRVGFRVHDLSSPHWRRDLDILIGGAGEKVAYITFPKASSAADVERQIAALAAAEKANGIKRPHPTPVHVLIETHGALRDVWRIAELPRVEALDFGVMDFVSSHHGAIPGWAMISPGQFEHPLVVRAKCEISAAALANGVIPSHTVCTELSDMDMVRDTAKRAREQFGCLRMWSIHPNQIDPILEAMRPDNAEVSVSAEILLAAQEADWGPIRYHDRLHDRASYRYYWQVLQRARATGMALPEAAASAFFD